MSKYSPQVQSNWGETFARALGQGVNSFIASRRQRNLDDRQNDEDALNLYHQGLREQTEPERLAVPNTAAVNTHLAAALNPSVGVAAPNVNPAYAGPDFAQALQAPVRIGSKSYVQTDEAKRRDQQALEDRAALLQDRSLGQNLKRSEIAKNNATATKDLRPADPRAPLLGSPEWKAAQEFSANLGRTSHQADRQYDADHPLKDPTTQKPSDGQIQSAMFANRMASAETLLQQHEKEGTTGVMTSMASTVPFVGGGLRNMVASKEQQLYRQAQEDWVRAKLRKESGAAIGKSEMEDEIATYFPQLNDSSDLIAQKAARRAEATRLLRTSSGNAAAMFDEATPASAAPIDGARRAPLAPRGGVQPQRGPAPAGNVNLGAPTPAQTLWDAAVAKHGRAKVLQEFGDRP